MVTLGAAGQLWTALFVSVGVITARVTSYTLETTAAVSFRGNAAEEFGYAVVQHRDSAYTTWLVVSSPLARGRSGLVHKCRLHPAISSSRHGCTNMDVQNDDVSPNGTLGLTLAKEESPSGKVLACAPLGRLSCGKNVFLKSSCYLFDNNLNQELMIAAGYQDCPISPIDMVILIDGSGSVSDTDFERTKDFVKAIIRTFKKKDNTQIAVVQFSRNYRLELSFLQFASSPHVEAIVSAIKQMRTTTQTANAINFIMNQVFTPSGGAKARAQKVLVVVTDGESNGGGLAAAIRRTQAERVVTYAIGVGDAFKPGSPAYAELTQLASDPDSEHMFPVDDYNALNSVLRRLEEKIFSIEGASGDLSTFEMELAATGMSAVINKGTITLGAVGAHGWMGGVVRHFSSGKSITSTNSTLDWQNMEGPSVERDSYLGYSLIQVKLSSISLLATGAPHSHHTGTVYLFDIRSSDSKLMIYQTLPGHQLGSYFGAVLCAVEQEQGGSGTALLLVSAPFYHTHGEEGRVYVYRRAYDGRFNLSQELGGGGGGRGGGGLRARFGSAMASMGDVTGDGWPDVAIGAPGEGDDGAGAVYLFSGRRDGFSDGDPQRISGSSQSGRVRMFGRSLHSLMDG
uniref:Integrin alpha-X-like isoform X1 n=2 Tax=Petromyzon marinus TaxID=7757 RepID=A0AAJ7UE20_PETMA|nr:integrin alpha-X-like isoform X1 [Petromyzon marinus]XP_032834732.1 integrin alpha-X-like isoform X1 [Petromyzon marinus]